MKTLASIVQLEAKTRSCDSRSATFPLKNELLSASMIMRRVLGRSQSYEALRRVGQAEFRYNEKRGTKLSLAVTTARMNKNQ